MNKLVFVSVVVGIWGMALFWIAMEPPKTNASVNKKDAEIAAGERSCGLVARVQYEVVRLSNGIGVAHLVPNVISGDSVDCSKASKEDGDEEHDPRANQIKGGLQRRKVIVSMLDTFVPQNLIDSILVNLT